MKLRERLSPPHVRQRIMGRSELTLRLTLHSPPPLFLRKFLVIYDELIINYIMALVAVALMSVFILGNFKIIALICFTVVCSRDGWILPRVR